MRRQLDSEILKATQLCSFYPSILFAWFLYLIAIDKCLLTLTDAMLCKAKVSLEISLYKRTMSTVAWLEDFPCFFVLIFEDFSF